VFCELRYYTKSVRYSGEKDANKAILGIVSPVGRHLPGSAKSCLLTKSLTQSGATVAEFART
jgi:hypothetical protein